MGALSELDLNASDLAAVVARARSLEERLSALDSSLEAPQAAAPSVPAAVREQLRLWKWAYSRGDEDSFRRRLAWDGLSESAVLRLLAAAERVPPQGSPSSSPPRWAEDLVQVLPRYAALGQRWRDGEALSKQAISRREDELPFVDLWLPFLDLARERLRAAVSDVDRLLSAQAVRDLEQHLLRELCAAGALVAYRRFDESREAAKNSPRSREEEASGPRHLYRSFLIEQCAGEITTLFREYPVLARDLCRLTTTWIESTEELLLRLRADLSEIARVFGDGSPPGIVERLHPGLSDRHRGGRQVALLTFAHGPRVIYKPRDMNLEKAYNDFLFWLADAGLGASPPALRTIARDGYGWAPFVTESPAADESEVRGYFERAGALLCLAYALRATDLHMDNVVATRDGPVLVDTETLLQPGAATTSGVPRPASAIERAYGRVTGSCLGTGLLSFYKENAEGRIHDLGGLRGRGGHPLGRTVRAWKQANTDAMHPVDEPAFAVARHNLLLKNDAPEMPEDHLEEVLAGFASAYRFLLSRREEILAEDGPLAKFTGGKTRVVFRSSDLYGQIQERFRTPKFQRDAISRGFLIDSLNSVFRSQHARPLLWPLIAQEREALEAWDIPHFTMPTDSAVPRSATGEAAPGIFATSGTAAVRRRIEDMSEEDLAGQLDLLRASLQKEKGGRSAHQVTVEDPGGAPAATADDEENARLTLSREALVDAANALGEELREHAIWGEDGSVTWIAAPYLRPDERDDRGVSYYLYSGACGIALFAAALARTGGRSAYEELARAACLPIHHVLDSRQTDTLLEHEPIGAGNGLGGIVYALVLLSRILRDGAFLETSERVANHLTTARITADRRLDVEGGAAGAVLGLAALHEETGEAWALERAVACGEHLLLTKTAVGDGWGWPGHEGIPLAGFAHGASGIAWALARLFLLTGQERFREAVRMAYRFERSLYCPTENNWPLLLRDPASGEVRRIHMRAWCHGAPGIALARARGLAAFADDESRTELENALEATRRLGLGRLDHLCCGSFGAVDVLLTVGRILERPGLIAAAETRAARVLKRAIVNEAFSLSLSRSETGCFRPGFFQGTSGIGYELLRLARPADLPSVLAFARDV